MAAKVKPESTWKAISLSAKYAVNTGRIWPSVGKFADSFDSGGLVATHLFYAGSINMLFGDSGTGKSWVAFGIAQQEARAKRHVVYVDFESAPRSVHDRLRDIGMTAEQIDGYFHYVDASGGFGDAEQLFLAQLVVSTGAKTLFIDTSGEAMGGDGYDANKDVDVIAWRNKLSLFYASNGLCVIELDHIGVGFDTRRVAGSFRKRAGLTGISIQAETYRGYAHARGREGRTKLIVRKDREGSFQKDQLATVFILKDDIRGEHGHCSFRPPAEDERASNDPDKPKVPERWITAASMMRENDIDISQSIPKLQELLFNLGESFGDHAVTKARKHLRDDGRGDEGVA
jgi:hypothetical protein